MFLQLGTSLGEWVSCLRNTLRVSLDAVTLVVLSSRRSAGFAVLALAPVFLTALDQITTNHPYQLPSGKCLWNLRLTSLVLDALNATAMLFYLPLEAAAALLSEVRDALILVPTWSSVRCQPWVAHPNECIFLAHWVHKHLQLVSLASVTPKSSQFNCL